jgi:hypothetical protein
MPDQPMDTELRINTDQQMPIIGHDSSSFDPSIELLAHLGNEVLQAFINPML